MNSAKPGSSPRSSDPDFAFAQSGLLVRSRLSSGLVAAAVRNRARTPIAFASAYRFSLGSALEIAGRPAPAGQPWPLQSQGEALVPENPDGWARAMLFAIAHGPCPCSADRAGVGINAIPNAAITLAERERAGRRCMRNGHRRGAGTYDQADNDVTIRHEIPPLAPLRQAN
jgi:hypothetical protein